MPITEKLEGYIADNGLCDKRPELFTNLPKKEYFDGWATWCGYSIDYMGWFKKILVKAMGMSDNPKKISITITIDDAKDGKEETT